MKKKVVVCFMATFCAFVAKGQTTGIDEFIPNDGSAVLTTNMSDVTLTAEDSILMQSVIELLPAELSKDPDKIAAGALSILLGGIGVGHFYTGQTLRGVLDIIFCWTGVPALIGIIEGVIWLCEDDDAWAERVAKWNSKK